MHHSLHRRGGVLLAAATFLGAVATTSLASPAAALPAAAQLANITNEFVAGGLWRFVMTAEWLPGDAAGRMFVGQSDGAIHLVTPSTGATTPLLDLGDVPFIPDDPQAARLDGLLDIAVDPTFATATDKFFYVYSVQRSTNRPRVERFALRASGDATALTRTVVWQAPGTMFAEATTTLGGMLSFGPDGMLYIGVGSGTDGNHPQQLDTVYGKVLRINKNGTVPTDNPFYDGFGSNVDEIWALGLRQPFRGEFRSNGELWLGDIGGDDPGVYEELNRIVSGTNYGYPSCNGAASATCATSGQPQFRYRIADPVPARGFNQAVVGGFWYDGALGGQHFPANFNGSYIYTDYTQSGRIYWWDPASGAQPVLYRDPEALPVWIDQSPSDGMIYTLDLGADGFGALNRLRYSVAPNRPPRFTGVYDALPLTGAAPLNVTFDIADNAVDPDGTALTYHWNFGDGQSASIVGAAGRRVTHRYAASGIYIAQLSVSSGGMTTRAAPVRIVAGRPPTALITSPGSGGTFQAGQSITLTGEGTTFTGVPIAGSALRWNVSFVKNGVSTLAFTGTGDSFTFNVPTSGTSWEGSTLYAVTLTATANSQTSTDSINLYPRKKVVSVTSSTASTVKVDGNNRGLPLALSSLIGFQHQFEAPAAMCTNNVQSFFGTWNDGGSRARTYTVDASSNLLTVSYSSNGQACGYYAAPTPLRLMDTRPGNRTVDGLMLGDGAFSRGEIRRVQISGRSGPAGATPSEGQIAAAALNVTVTGPTASGFLTVWPAASDPTGCLARPLSSNVNFVAGAVVPNAAAVRIGAGGAICIFASVGTHVVVDYTGYVADESELQFLPEPRRIHDTRTGQRTYDRLEQGTGALAAGTAREIQVAGRVSIPNGSESVVLNVTAASPAAAGFLTVWACDQPRPGSSNVNVRAGQTRAGFVASRLSATGKVCVFSSTNTHLVVDVSGWFSDSDLLAPLAAPARLVDTRPSGKTIDNLQKGTGALVRNTPFVVRVAGRADLPGAVRAVALNVTATNVSASLFVKVYPCGTPVPATSVLNATPGAAAANAVWTRVGADGTVCVIASQPTHLVVDVAGMFVN